MAYVITQNCCNDAGCVPVCPVNCIHPTPAEPGYGTTDMLFIDPGECIDCGACVDACPVSAISAEDELPELSRYPEINARYYAEPENSAYDPTPARSSTRRWDPTEGRSLRVAVVGSGPAACYAAQELLAQRGLDVAVDMYERLPAPWGLVRYGVAPDHQDTKAAAASFDALVRNRAFRLVLDVEVGRDVAHEQLVDRYHAVIYATGAPEPMRLAVPGEDLPGSHSAGDFVAWYNGHPDHTDQVFDLSGERVVVVGNGNVALDVARVLLSDVDRLAATDIADHALDALRASSVREVVVVGRRTALDASFTVPELLGLSAVAGIGLRIDGPTGDDGAARPDTGWLATARRYRAELLDELDGRGPSDRQVTFRFLSSPVAILGGDRVSAVVLGRNELVEAGGVLRAVPTGEQEAVPCGMVLSAIGHRTRPLSGVPFDDARGVIPNDEGRVIDRASGRVVAGVYVTGWAKRGPSGMIGTNRHCARRTVAALLDDLGAGALRAPADSTDLLEQLPGHLDAAAWQRIDGRERAEGRARSRPRVKLVDRAELTRVGRGGT